ARPAPPSSYSLSLHDALPISSRLDPQQVLQRQSVAPLLQCQHHFAGSEIGNEARKIVNLATGDCLVDLRALLSHVDEANDGKAALRPLRQLPQTSRTGPCPKNQYSPAKRRGAEET